MMFLQIFLGAIILIALAGIILAIKYYKQKYWPLCSLFGRFQKHKPCIVCGAERAEDCTKDSHSSE